MAIEDDLRRLIDSQMSLVAGLYERGSLAPLAATLDTRGEISGKALTIDGDSGEHSVDAVVDHFQQTFAAGIEAGAIRAAAIFFHGFLDDQGASQIAHLPQEAQVLIVRLFHAEQPGSADAIIRYR